MINVGILIWTKFDYKLGCNSIFIFYFFKFATYFENLIVRLHVFYTFNASIKFFANRILFTIGSINLFLCVILDYKNLQF